MMDYNFQKARQAWATVSSEPYKEGTMFPPNQTLAGISPVASELKALEESIRCLSESISALEEKLAPALSEPFPEQDGLATTAAGSSMLFNTICDFNNVVKRLVRRVNTSRERLEL